MVDQGAEVIKQSLNLFDGDEIGSYSFDVLVCISIFSLVGFILEELLGMKSLALSFN